MLVEKKYLLASKLADHQLLMLEENFSLILC
jgi:hypothetical protein